MPREGWRSVTIPLETKQLLENCVKHLKKNNPKVSESKIASEAIIEFCNRKEVS